MITPFFLLVCIALLLCVCSFIFPGYPLTVAVLIVCVALLIGGYSGRS